MSSTQDVPSGRGWVGPAPPGLEADSRARAVGAAIALGISLGVVLFGWSMGLGPAEAGADSSALSLAVGMPLTGRWLVMLGLFGAPVATALGWVLAPRAVRARDRRDVVTVVLLLAFGTVFFGSFEVVGAGLGAAALTEGTQLSALEVLAGIPAILLLGLIGLVIVGPYALVVTIPAAVLWLLLIRLAAGWLRLKRAGDPE